MAERDYDVKRAHEGDKFYHEGDVRSISESDARHLVALGVLVPRGQKAEPAPLNKAEQASPVNKGGYDAMTVSDLKSLADERKIDLGDATKKADIIAALQLSDETQS